MKKYLIKIIFLLTIFYTDIQFANEILIYADSISYDSEKNLIAKGNVKIINANEIITSDLIIYNNAQQKYILPKKFTFKDEKNNYYYGESGYFSKNFKRYLSKITKAGGIILLLTGIAILTGQLQILGFFILEYFPSLGNLG